MKLLILPSIVVLLVSACSKPPANADAASQAKIKALESQLETLKQQTAVTTAAPTAAPKPERTISGTYAGEGEVFDFRTNGKVYINELGTALVAIYRFDDDKLIIDVNNRSLVFDVHEDYITNGSKVFRKQ